ncbi:MAG TPA: hypothetical protein VK892_13340, partial [Pyrinomonadaceae bacterium]|nr:hypothetical protein [Pyrinomonadaceae bacterium]
SELLSSIQSLPNKPFVSEKGNFSIMLPESNDNFLWNFKEGEIRLNFFDLGYFVKAFDDEDFKIMVDRFNFDTIVNLKSKISEDLSKVDTKSRTAITYFVLDKGEFGIQKYRLVGKRLYVLLAIIKDKNNQKIFEEVLDTFKVTRKPDSDSFLKEILDKITHPSLPQNPVVIGEKNDLYDENLKGKVKQITWYSQSLHYPVSEKRHFDKIQEFDRRGYLLKETTGIDFDNPYSVEVFGFINGKRVSFFGFHIYNFSLFPRPEESASAGETETFLKPEYDLGYTTAFEKKYKNGKLSEKIWYNSSGRIIYRRTYSYQEDKVTALGYDFNGNLIMKTVSTTDKYGNYISEIRTNRGNSAPSTEFFQYEFDKQGNWIKQIHILKFTDDGKEVPKPQFAIHRTITYFQ